ncbi:MAG: mannose-1-phosphate guanylyltransferase [Anaerolineae bacterium]
MTDPLYGVILAGGAGTRLWPRSRRRTPKQLLDLLSGKTMLRETYERLEPLLPAERLSVITGSDYVDLVQRELSELAPEAILLEPDGRGSAPAIGLAAAILERRDPQAVMACLPADHVVGKPQVFRDAIRTAAQVAQRGYLVTLGIVPDRIETGYGYIQRGGALEPADGEPVFRVTRFTEKPGEVEARRFVASGEYYWNSGMFIWRVTQILEEIRRWMPQLSEVLSEVGKAAETGRLEGTLRRVWPDVEPQTIDYGVMERADRVAVLPVDMGWSDVGSWASLLELLPSDEAGNVIRGDHMGIDTSGSLIHGSSRLVATAGVSNLIIVDTEDALLVCPVDRAQDIKSLVEALGDSGREGVL